MEDITLIDFREARYTRIHNKVLEDTERLTLMSDIAVYIALCKHADNDKPRCNPKIQTIAKYARCSERTVKRTLERLVTAGLIQVEHRYNNHGHRASSIYYLLEPK